MGFLEYGPGVESCIRLNPMLFIYGFIYSVKGKTRVGPGKV